MIARAALGLALIPVVFLAWYTLAAIPVSIAIILGACIIFCAIRSLPGRTRRIMGSPAEQQLPRRIAAAINASRG